MKRVLILSQFCTPEPDLKAFPIAKALKERGFDVEILTGHPNYPGGKLHKGYNNRRIKTEYVEGIRVVRVPLYIDHSTSSVKRIFNYLSFALSCVLFGTFKIKKPAVVYAYHAPATIAIPAIFFKLFFRSKILYDINDFWPDSLTSTGMVKSRRLYDLVSWYCKKSYLFFDKINVVSEGFKERLLALNVPENKISVIYNWSLPLGFSGSEKFNEFKELFDNYYTVLYAGNIGYAQNLEIIIKVAIRLRETGNKAIRFVIIGSGTQRQKIETLMSENSLENVVLIDQVPPASIGKFLRAASVLFLHLKDDALFRITIPSKLAAYLSIGKPILSGVLGESEVLLNTAKAGKSFIPDDENSLIEALFEMFNTAPSDLVQMGENGSKFYKEHLSFDKGIEEFEKIIREL